MGVSFVQSSFVGGEWSQTAIGNLADPKYKVAMSASLNGFPTEPGAWTRRSGTLLAGTTRNGNDGRLIPFAFQQTSPYNIEFTNNFLRFWTGPSLVMTNDAQAVVAISAANPAVVQTTTAHGWATGNSVVFNSLGANNPLLQNRVFLITVVDTTHFSIADALTGATIDGSTLGTFVSGNVTRVLEFSTPYGGDTWQNNRLVQTDNQGIILNGSYQPQVLTVTTDPTSLVFGTFTLAGAVFLDGPYLDPVGGGAQLTPSATTGIPGFIVSFPAYISTKAYKVGDYVTASTISYQSLIDQNVGNTPASSPSAWKVVSASQAIGPNGFQASDIGRSVRMACEPPLWVTGTTYGVGATVEYSGVYWTSITASNTGNIPGVDLQHWQINPTGATWTWGRITGLQNQIDGNLSGAVHIGTLTGNGGLAAGFDGVDGKVLTQSALFTDTNSFSVGTYHAYIGQNYSGASAQKVLYATLYGSQDNGMFGRYLTPTNNFAVTINLTINLRAKQTAPSSGSDGTLLGSQFVGAITNGGSNVITLGTTPVTIASNDPTTAWNYVWFEIVGGYTTQGQAMNVTYDISASQVRFFGPASSSSNGVSIEILGNDLLNTNPIRTWRLGLYDGSNWPTCGTYHEGRLWLSGSVPNRFDGSVANDIFNFAPTQPDGTVTDANAIDYTLNATEANPIFWMEPDQQGILIGTQAGEWLVQATALNQPLTPLNIQAHRVTKIGCANIEPRRSEHTLLIVQKHKRKIIEYFADIFSGKFTAPNLAEKAKHLTVPGIAEIAYQQELNPTLWVRMDDGTLKGMTYKRDTLMTSQGPTFAAWHRHTLGSGRLVSSIAVGPSRDGTLDSLAMVTASSTVGARFVELMADMFEEGGTLAAASFLDAAVTPSSYASAYSIGGAPGLILNGLWNLNGSTCTAFIGGIDCGDWPVSNGSMTVEFYPSTKQTNSLFTADFVANYVGTLPIVVGFNYTSQGQLLPPDTQPESGTRAGPGFGKMRRLQEYAARLVNTQGIKFGTDFGAGRLNAAQLRSPGGTRTLAANELFTGVIQDSVRDDYGRSTGMLCWEISRPFPATVAAISGFLETQDE